MTIRCIGMSSMSADQSMAGILHNRFMLFWGCKGFEKAHEVIRIIAMVHDAIIASSSDRPIEWVDS